VEDFIRFGYTACWIEGGSNIATYFVDVMVNGTYYVVGCLAWGSVLCRRFKGLNVLKFMKLMLNLKKPDDIIGNMTTE
jgi:hypothetical protein